MPLDPTIANPQGVKIADPLEQYGNMLRSQYLQSEIQQRQQANALLQSKNRAFASSVGTNGQLDWNALPGNLAKENVGSEILPAMMDKSKIDATTAEAGMNIAKGVNYNADALKKSVEGVAKGMAGVSADPAVGLNQFLQRYAESHRDPNIAKHLADMGVDPTKDFQQTYQEAMQAASSGQWPQYIAKQQMGAKDASEMQYMDIDRGTSRTVLAIPKNVPGQAPQRVGEYSVTPVPKTQVTVNNIPAKAQGAYWEGMGKGVSQVDLDLRSAAGNAPDNVSKLDKIASLVKGGALTGMGADAKNNLLRLGQTLGFVAPPGVSPDAVAYTQELQKFLANNILSQVGDLHKAGISRMTNMDLELLKQGSAQGNMDPKAILDIVGRQRQSYQDYIKKYNSRIGELRGNPENAQSMSELGIHALPEILNPDGSMTGANGRTATAASIAHLRSNPKLLGEFDKTYGPGSAERILGSDGGTPTGGSPFPRR